MKYIDEYREKGSIDKLLQKIKGISNKKWTLMEVCGGQTHSIIRYGLDQLLPDEIQLIHGPGCPVCVTPLESIDRALKIAEQDKVIFCSYGDMLRVPGSETDLLSLKAKGADIRMVYSPMDVISIAQKNPDREVVFFAVGFETTAAPHALAIDQAKTLNLQNLSFLISHVLVPPAIEAILQSKSNKVQGFLAAGHVCTVKGFNEYIPIAKKYQIPIIVTGFEPVDILEGVLMLVEQLESGKHEVLNQYARSVSKEGNIAAQTYMEKVFEVVDRSWRGIGNISNSGLGLKESYSLYDASKRFDLNHIQSIESNECRSGEVLQGIIRPDQCPAFGNKCHPENPLGATMVSSEGACAAYHQYRNHESSKSHG